MAAGIGTIIGWIAHILVSEPDEPTRERHLIEAYGQGWRACETYFARRSEARSTEAPSSAPAPSERGEDTSNLEEAPADA